MGRIAAGLYVPRHAYSYLVYLNDEGMGALSDLYQLLGSDATFSFELDGTILIHLSHNDYSLLLRVKGEELMLGDEIVDAPRVMDFLEAEVKFRTQQDKRYRDLLETAIGRVKAMPYAELERFVKS